MLLDWIAKYRRMDVELLRYAHGKNDTLGILRIDGEFQCYTLEDEFRVQKVHGETRIPAGRYKLGLRHSPKFSPVYGHDVVWIMDVPGFEFILIHTGNTEADTDGCPLVGSYPFTFDKGGKNTIADSKKAYGKVYPLLVEQVKKGAYIQIKDL